MKQCEFPKCGRGKSRCMCEGEPVTAPADAVAQAKYELDRWLEAAAAGSLDVDGYVMARDALIAAVRAECVELLKKIAEAERKLVIAGRDAYTEERLKAAWDEAYRRVEGEFRGMKREWDGHDPVDVKWHREFIAAFNGLPAAAPAPPSPREAVPSVPTFTVGTHGDADHCSACGFIARTQAWSEHIKSAHGLTVPEWEQLGGKQVVPEAAPSVMGYSLEVDPSHPPDKVTVKHNGKPVFTVALATGGE